MPDILYKMRISNFHTKKGLYFEAMGFWHNHDLAFVIGTEAALFTLVGEAHV